jgi:hypothetical protein
MKNLFKFIAGACHAEEEVGRGDETGANAY